MNWFRDIFIKRKLLATIAVVSTVALLPVSGGFVSHEMITPPKTMTHDAATRVEVFGDRSFVTCSADNAILNFNDRAALKLMSAYLPASSSRASASMNGKS